LARTVYLDALDYDEFCSGAPAHALDCGWRLAVGGASAGAAILRAKWAKNDGQKKAMRRALERQADAGFEIAAIVADPDIAAKADHREG
jgi:hypothetical protein